MLRLKLESSTSTVSFPTLIFSFRFYFFGLLPLPFEIWSRPVKLNLPSNLGGLNIGRSGGSGGRVELLVMFTSVEIFCGRVVSLVMFTNSEILVSFILCKL